MECGNTIEINPLLMMNGLVTLNITKWFTMNVDGVLFIKVHKRLIMVLLISYDII